MAKTSVFRNILGELPLAAELDYTLRHAVRDRARKDHYNLHRLEKSLPALAKHAAPYAATAPVGKRILFFATLHYWVEQSAVISLVLAGLGHKVTLLTLPYSEWHKKMDKLTQRQRVLHTRDALSALGSAGGTCFLSKPATCARSASVSPGGRGRDLPLGRPVHADA